VKPSNVMVSDEGVVKVLDFGLAKPLAPVSFRTQAGHVLGTPRYMAPEQLAGAEIDARTDQYAYGLTAYELVAGKHPGGVLAGPVDVPLLDAIVPEVSRAVAQVIARAMANVPDDRFASMEEVAVALEDAVAGRRARGAIAGGTGAGAREAREPSEITALEAPVTEPPVTDTVRFDEVASGHRSETTAATTKRAGGDGAAVVAQIDVLPAGAAEAEAPADAASAEPASAEAAPEERDPEADRPTVTARPVAQVMAAVAAPMTPKGTLLMADAPRPVAAKTPARPPERTLLSADGPATPPPVAKTLLAAGAVTPEMAAARDRAVRDADAKAKADADAKADARAKAKAKAKADAPVSVVPAGLAGRRRSPVHLATGVVLLGAMAFGAAYYGSKQPAGPAAATSSSAARDAGVALVTPTAKTTANATGTLNIMPLGSAPSASASMAPAAPTPAASERRPTRPAATSPPPQDFR